MDKTHQKLAPTHHPLPPFYVPPLTPNLTVLVVRSGDEMSTRTPTPVVAKSGTHTTRTDTAASPLPERTSREAKARWPPAK